MKDWWVSFSNLALFYILYIPVQKLWFVDAVSWFQVSFAGEDTFRSFYVPGELYPHVGWIELARCYLSSGLVRRKGWSTISWKDFFLELGELLAGSFQTPLDKICWKKKGMILPLKLSVSSPKSQMPLLKEKVLLKRVLKYVKEIYISKFLMYKMFQIYWNNTFFSNKLNLFSFNMCQREV